MSIALLVMATGAVAQNKLVKKAQGLIDEGKLEEAQTLVTEALNSGETKDMRSEEHTSELQSPD